jgi:acetyl-CoA C-acetyltransferase
LLPRQNPIYGKFEVQDSLERDGLWEVYNKFAMGHCGEHAAAKFGISRESQDEHAINSYKRAARAWETGAFKNEIAPVVVKGKKGETVVNEDEEFKRVIFDKVPTLRPVFKKDGSITAANSSSLNDGASALILMSAEMAKELGVKPLAKILCKAFTRKQTNKPSYTYRSLQLLLMRVLIPLIFQRPLLLPSLEH